MNKSYRSIWNEALGAWVAASEIASARGKKSRSAQRQLAALGLGMLLLGGPALAQVGVGTPSPDPSSWLTIGPDPGAGVPNKGVLMPRAALTDATTWGLAAPTPVEGMVVFNTTAGTSANGLGVGLMTWKNGRWVNVDETPYLHVNSTAVGNSTQANSGAIGVNSVAIGPDAKALANDTVAMGNGAEAHKLGDIAIGRAAIASGGDRLTGPTENWSSVAVGTYASATEGNSVALGGSAKAEGRGTALGSRAEAGYDTVAIGTFAGMGRPAKADPNDFSNSLNTFVGSGSGASGNGARNSYVGNQAGFAVQGDENAGMGYGAGGLSSGNRNVAVGQRAGQFVTGDQNINQGTMAGLQSKGSNNIALGTLASANLALAAQDPNAPISQAAVQAANLAAQTEYMGFLATRGVTEAGLADGTYTLDASGNVIEASSGNVLVTAAELQTSVTQAFQRNGVAGIDASRTTAIGHLSRATGDDAVALGSSAVAGDKAAVAIGTASKAFGVSSVAVGDNAFAKGEASIAMGKGAQANGTQSISIGTGNVVNGNNSGAIGDPSTIDGANSYSVGNNNTLGAAASNTFVLGNNVNVNVANATALGDSTSVTVADGAALGSKSVASTDKGVAGFDPAAGKASTDTSATWKSTLGAVSVGGNGQTRQITNVAAGTQATDAVNVAQLKAAQTHYYSVNDNGTQGGNYDNKGATGLNAIASGVDAKAGGDHATAMGHGATAGGHYAIAQGYQANAAGANGVAIGTQASAAKGGTVAIGASAGKDSTVLTGTFIGAGAGNKSAGADITAIGNNAGQAASGNSNTFIGATAGSSSEGDLNSFIGAGAGIFSKGTANSAFGNLAGANTEGDSNAAWGFAAGAFVKGDGNIGMGTSAGASVVGSGNAAIGQGAGLGTQGDANLAIGAGAGSIAKGNGNVALGQNAGLAADGNENIALGQTAGALVSGNRNLAIGSAAGLAGDVAAGNITPTTASDTIALGTQAFANAERAIAIGTGAQALGTQSISIGTGNVVNGNNSGAIGDPTVIDGANSYSVGNNNTLGAAANNTFVLGNNVNVNVANATALGDSTGVTVADGVALGSKSVASTDKGVAGFDPATGLASTDTSATWKSTLGAVSVGGNGQTRQITNVAAGTQATDAVNVAQLKAGQTHYYSVNDNGVQGGNYANDGATGINALAAGVGAQANGERSVSIGYLAGVGASAGLAGQNNVGIGTEAGGGVVGSSNTAVGSAAGKDVAGSSNAAFGIAAGQGVQGDYNLAMGVYSGIGTKGTYNTAIGGSAGQAVTGNDNIAMGDLSGASVVGDANIGIGALAGAGTTGSSNIAIGSLAGIVDTATFAGITANNTVSIGNSAVASKDDGVAVGHGAQAAAVNSVALGADSKATQDAAALALKNAYVPAGATTVAGTAPVGEVSVGSAGKERRITNVAAGSDDTDAVNVSQLKGAQTHYYSVNDNGTQGGNYDNKGATGLNAIAAGVDAVAAGVGTVAVGNLAGSGSTAAGNSHNTFVGYGAGRQVAGADNTAVGNSAGVSVTGGNNTALGLSAGARVTGDSNIGIGVNGGAVTTGFSNVGIGSSAGQGTNGAFNVALGGLAGGGVQGSANVAIGLNAGESVSASNTVAIGTRAKATGESGVSIGTDASATYANAVALGANSTTASDLATLNANAAYVPPGATSVAGAVPVGEVSVGGVGAERRITNVAAGAVDTDAVNVSQLKAVDATANAGWNVAANGEATGGNVAPGAKVDFSNSDSNIAITRTGTDLDFKLADDVKVNNSVTVGQSVLNTTGLTVNDGTTTTAVAAGGVTSGTVKLSGVTNDIQGLSNKTLTDPSFATVGRAATEEQLKIVNDTASAGWNVAANGEATGGNVAPGGKVDFSNSDSNIAITRTGTNLDFKLADDVKVNNSVTVGQSVLNTTGLTVNNGTTTTAVAAGGVTSGTVNLSGVTNDIQGLSNKTLTDPSFATVGRGATEEQLKIVNDTASAGWNVAANGEATGGNVAPGGKVDFSNSDSNVTITRSGTNLDFKLADDVKVNNSVTVGQSVLNTTGLTVNNGTTTTAVAAGGVTSGTVNLSGVTNDIQGLSNKTLTDPSFATVGRGATEEQLKLVNDTASAGWNVAANGEATGGNVAPGGKVDFSNSDSNIAITRTGTNLDFKLADDVKVNNSVTVGQSVLNTTGLTVNDGAGNVTTTSATGTNVTNGTTTTAVAAGGVTSGTVNLSGVSNDIQGLSNKTLTDPSFATVGRAATEEQLKIVNDTASAGWNVAANGEATGGNVAPGGKVDFSNSDSNIAITRSGTNLDFKLADDVKVNNSVTVGQSVLNTTGLTINNGTTTTAVAAGGVTSGTVNLSGVTNDIKGLSNKTLTDPSFATVGRGATEEQLKIVNETASAGWNVAANGEATGGNVAPGGKVDFSNSDSNIAITRSGTNLDFKLADDVKVNNSVTVGQSVLNTTGLTVNNGTTTTAVAAGGVTSGSVNLSGVTNDIKGLSNTTLTDPSFATVGRAATEEQLKKVNDTASAGWNVAANGEATGGNVAPGGKVDFSNSDSNIAITRTGTNLDFKLADDVKVNNSVTVGQSVLNTTGLTVNNGTTTTAVAAGGVTSGTVNLSGVSNDIQGLSNKTLTDPSFATVGRGATEEQLKIVNDTASAGWNVAANGEATGGNVAPGGKVDFSNSDSNIAITRTGTNLDFKLANDVKVNNSVTVGQSVLNTTGLTVNDGTTTTAVAAGGVTSGTVKLSGVSNDIQGLSNKTLTDPSFATVGRAATEEQLKQVNDTASAGWNVAANGEATGGNVAPGAKVDFSNSDSNIAITRTGTNLDFKLADDVKVNNSVTVGQSVLNTTGLTVNDGAGNVTKTAAAGTTVTNGTTTTAVAAGGVTSGTVKLSGVSNDIQGLSNKTLTDPSFATVGRAATEEQLKLVDATASKGWNLSANGEATPQNIAPGGTANFANGDNMVVTRNGNTLTVATAKDVKFDSVTTGDTVMNNAGVTVGPNVTLGATGLTIVGGPSVTTAGVDAGGKVITHVAPGVAGTDAVNVSQLKDTVAESKTKYYSVNSTGGGNENNDGATGADAIAAGKDAQATAVNAVAMGTAAQAAGVSATSIGNAAWAMGDRSTAVGYFSTADGIDSAAFGAWARAGGNGSVAAGMASNASGVASVAMGALSAAAGDVSVAVGAGSTATAAGGAALGAGAAADRAAGVKGYVPPEATAAQADAIAATTSTTGAVGVGDAAHGVFRQITGVAAGSAPSDAVNVAQLQAVASQAAAAGSKWITGSPTTYVAPTSTGTDSTAVGSGAAVKADQGVAIGTGAVVTTKNSVALGNDSTTAEAKPTEEVTLQGTTYQFAGTKPVGVVSVGSKDAERQITNVAAGEISATSTDAVNGSQLNATNQAINNMTTGGGGIKYFHANSKAADSDAKGAESVAIGPKAVATGNNSIATGNNAQAKAAGSIALGANSTASTANSVALGDGAVANRAGMNGQREMFSNTAVQSAQGAVSVGAAGNERQITNVAGGTQATDAVNVRQLQAVQQSAVRYDTNVDGSVNYNSVTMGNGASTGPVTVQNVAPGVAPTDAVNVQQLNQAGAAGIAYTDARTNALGNELRNTAKNAYAGVAAAMAVQMPGTSVPGKTVMRVGYGTFKGESAVGISFRRTAENNGWSVTGGVGMSRAGAAATVGAEWVFN
ncbi:autotransporter adhesin [Variovorax boronicumulans]|uniref:ESPR-type extended signal peptide-containing protein n=1 Tax=Variovorax boronicumulans TaxID=436515 RepID=UPI00277EBAFF|nr:ESPR-type extended signal peptide-containing protein [Variovorax boronicumulans]MDP9909520.1 autotransporter adhesin [Variovorax boronicumulans]